MYLQPFDYCASSAFPLLDSPHTTANEGHTWVWGSLDGVDDFLCGCKFNDPLTIGLLVPGFDVSHLALQARRPTSSRAGVEVDKAPLIALNEVDTLVKWSKHDLGGADTEVSDFFQAGVILSLETWMITGN